MYFSQTNYFVFLSTAALLLVANLSTALTPRIADENRFTQKELDFSMPEDNDADAKWLKSTSTKPKFIGAQVKRVDGMLRFTQNDVPLSFISYSAQEPPRDGAFVERQMAEYGVNCFIVDINMYRDNDYSIENIVNKAKIQCERLLEAAPDAKIILRLSFRHAGEDYFKMYPDALLTEPDGNTKWSWKHTRWEPNFLNNWRRYCGEKLYRSIEALGQESYAGNIIGVYIFAMFTGEWWYPKDGKFYWDYSKERQEVFKKYLHDKYGESGLKFLRKHWNAQNDEELFRLPTREERRLITRDPDSRVANYLQVLNLPVSNNARYFAKVIKSASKGRLLAGMEIHCDLNIMQINGSVFLNQMLDCPEIDFLGSPNPYEWRMLGTYSPERAPLSSFERHNKIWFNEDDIRTHQGFGFAQGTRGCPPPSEWGCRQMLRRQFLAARLRGFLPYLMDFLTCWYDDPSVIEEVATMLRLDKLISEMHAARTAEIAIVSDQNSQQYVNYFSNPSKVSWATRNHWGADYDFYELRDLIAEDNFRKYKLIVFLNIAALSSEERAGIEKMKSDNRSLLFLHDPGTINLSYMDADPSKDMSELTGIKLRYAPGVDREKIIFDKAKIKQHTGMSLSCNALESEAKIATNISSVDMSVQGGLYMGNVFAKITCGDNDAIHLGTDAEERPLFVKKKYPDWTAYYSQACMLPPPVISAVAQKAGCHLYSLDNDVVMQAGDFIMVHAASEGEKQLFLKTNTPAWEIYSDNIYPAKHGKVKYQAQKGETFLFYTGNIDKAREAWHKTALAQQQTRREYLKKYPSGAPRTPGLFNWRKSKRTPENKREFGLKAFCPEAIAVSGPYDMKDWEIITPQGSVSASLFPSPLPRFSNKLSTFTRMEQPLPANSSFSGWNPFMYGVRPWCLLDSLGIGKGQFAYIAFYVECKPGKKVELYFADSAGGSITLNGSQLKGTPGKLGTIIELPQTKNLFMIKTANISGNDGFTIKFMEPIEDKDFPERVKPSFQAEGLKILPGKQETDVLNFLNMNEELIFEADSQSPGAGELWNGDVIVSQEGFIMPRGDAITSRKWITLEPDKRYVFYLQAAKTGNITPNIIAGFLHKDTIDFNVFAVPESETVLTRPVNKKDRSIWIKNGGNWKAGDFRIAFDIDPDGKQMDLPNRKLSVSGIEQITQRSKDEWEVKLSSPAGQSAQSGSPVRQQRHGSRFNVLAAKRLMTEGFVEIYGVSAGFAQGVPGNREIWPGASEVRIQLAATPGFSNENKVIFNKLKVFKIK